MPRPPHCGTFVTGCCVLVLASFAPAEMVTLPSVADTSLWELDPDFNFGRQRTLPSGSIGRMFPADTERSRALYRFDVLGAVPPGGVIKSARMALTIGVLGTPEGGRSSDFVLSRVLVDWGEGVGFGENPGGEDALPGEATWNYRLHPEPGQAGTPWSQPGGVFGVDFATEQIALVEGVTGDRNDATTYFFNFKAAGLADLQAMVDGSLPNYGWILHSLGEGSRKTARRWTSRETRPEVEGRAPELEITWSPPRPALVVELDESTQELVARTAGQVGFSYQLQSSANLIDWIPGEIQVPAADGELVFRLPLGPGPQFVRVETTKLPG